MRWKPLPPVTYPREVTWFALWPVHAEDGFVYWLTRMQATEDWAKSYMEFYIERKNIRKVTR